MKQRNLLLIFVLVLLAGAALFLSIKHTYFGKTGSRYASVSEGSIDLSVVADGELTVKSYANVSASSAFKQKLDVLGSLKIKSIVAEGKMVRAGEVVAILDREPILNAVKQAEQEASALSDQALRAFADTTNQLRDARYSLSTLRINMEISQINMEQSFYDPPAAQKKSKLEFEKAKLAYEQALQSYRQKKQQIEDNAVSLQTKADLASKKMQELQRLLSAAAVRAPKAGVVVYYTDITGAKRQQGSLLSPDDLTVALIPNSSSIYSTFMLEEQSLAKVGENRNAKVAVPLAGDDPFQGRIEEVSGLPQVVNGKKCYAVSVRILNPTQALRPLMSTINDISVSRMNNVLYLPKKAVFEEDGRFYVYTEDRKRQEVVVKGSNSENSAIAKGVSKGQRVLLARPADADRYQLSSL